MFAVGDCAHSDGHSQDTNYRRWLRSQPRSLLDAKIFVCSDFSSPHLYLSATHSVHKACDILHLECWREMRTARRCRAVVSLIWCSCLDCARRYSLRHAQLNFDGRDNFLYFAIKEKNLMHSNEPESTRTLQKHIYDKADLRSRTVQAETFAIHVHFGLWYALNTVALRIDRTVLIQIRFADSAAELHRDITLSVSLKMKQNELSAMRIIKMRSPQIQS